MTMWERKMLREVRKQKREGETSNECQQSQGEYTYEMDTLWMLVDVIEKIWFLSRKIKLYAQTEVQVELMLNLLFTGLNRTAKGMEVGQYMASASKKRLNLKMYLGKTKYRQILSLLLLTVSRSLMNTHLSTEVDYAKFYCTEVTYTRDRSSGAEWGKRLDRCRIARRRWYKWRRRLIGEEDKGNERLGWMTVNVGTICMEGRSRTMAEVLMEESLGMDRGVARRGKRFVWIYPLGLLHEEIRCRSYVQVSLPIVFFVTTCRFLLIFFPWISSAMDRPHFSIYSFSFNRF